MKLQIMSDLHLDLLRKHTFTPAKTDADVLILAGDIHKGTEGITWGREQFPHIHIIYVAGNHEYYDRTWSVLLPQLRRTAEDLGVSFLDCNAIEINGTRFLGATLWTDFDLYGTSMRERAMSRASVGMYDYTAINLRPAHSSDPLGKRSIRLTPQQTRTWSLAAQAWFEQQLSILFSGPTVIVTHHLPSLRSVHPRYAGDALNPAFASDCERMFAVPTLWVHGHTHETMDYVCPEGMRVVCNPRGYVDRNGRKENRRFRSDFVVELI